MVLPPPPSSNIFHISFQFVVQPAPCFPSARLTVAMLAYMMGVCNYLMRANLSVAIVCMNSDSFTLVDESNDGFNNGTVQGRFLNETHEDIAPQVKVRYVSSIALDKCSCNTKLQIFNTGNYWHFGFFPHGETRGPNDDKSILILVEAWFREPRII